MPKLWISQFRSLLTIALISTLLGFIHSLALGLLFCISGLLFLLLRQTYHLVALSGWLKTKMHQEDFPNAEGICGDVFLELVKKLKDLQKIRQSAAEELQCFNDAINALPDGVVMLDAQQRIIWCNRQAETHLGIDARRDHGLILPQIFRISGFRDYINSVKSDQRFIFPSTLIPNRTYALEVVSYGILRKLIITFDITERQRTEDMRRDFVANVSHELRTPLTVVSGFLEHFVSGNKLSDEQRQRFAQIMNDQSQRMLRLVDDLLALSRLEANDVPQNEEYIVLEEFIAELAYEGDVLSAGKQRIIIEGNQSGRLRGSRHELQSALGNLISNAVRYSPAGSHITLQWQLLDNEGIFSVKDNGCGIAAEHIPRLTERFYRVDKGRSRDTGGTGLGLAIVKHVLLRHQATLDIKSTLGVGSVFSARFPRWRCHP